MTNVGQLVLLLAGAGATVWLLHKVGRAVTRAVEALASVAVVFVTVWLLVKALYWIARQVVRHWRTSLTTAAVLAWSYWLGPLSLLVTLAGIAVGLLVWRRMHRSSFEPWAGRRIRAWWQRWTVYAPRMPRWLRACGLTVSDRDQPSVSVQISPFRPARTGGRRRHGSPRVVGVRSGPSWDEVRVRLVPGQTPEDFDQAARALAVARGVARCQVRELAPDLVSIDFQRTNASNTGSAGAHPTSSKPPGMLAKAITRQLTLPSPTRLPPGSRPSGLPGEPQCKGKAHKPEHLGIVGRRVLVSRKWSNKSLADHRAERAAFVRQPLDRAGVRPGYAVDDGPFEWERTKPGDPDVPTRPALLLHAISERQRWKADYEAAQLAAGPPPEDRSATRDQEEAA